MQTSAYQPVTALTSQTIHQNFPKIWAAWVTRT